MQSKKFKALYKCRVCGHTYTSKGTDDKDLAIKSTFYALNNRSLVEPYEIHMCKNGSIGIADFCGFNTEDCPEPHQVQNCNLNIVIDGEYISQKITKEIEKEIKKQLNFKEEQS